MDKKSLLLELMQNPEALKSLGESMLPLMFTMTPNELKSSVVEMQSELLMGFQEGVEDAFGEGMTQEKLSNLMGEEEAAELYDDALKRFYDDKRNRETVAQPITDKLDEMIAQNEQHWMDKSVDDTKRIDDKGIGGLGALGLIKGKMMAILGGLGILALMKIVMTGLTFLARWAIVPLTVGSMLFDFVTGYQNSDAEGKLGKTVDGLMKMREGLAQIVEFLTFGFIDKETVDKAFEDAQNWMTDRFEDIDNFFKMMSSLWDHVTESYEAFRNKLFGPKDVDMSTLSFDEQIKHEAAQDNSRIGQAKALNPFHQTNADRWEEKVKTGKFTQAEAQTLQTEHGVTVPSRNIILTDEEEIAKLESQNSLAEQTLTVAGGSPALQQQLTNEIEENNNRLEELRDPERMAAAEREKAREAEVLSTEFNIRQMEEQLKKEEEKLARFSGANGSSTPHGIKKIAEQSHKVGEMKKRIAEARESLNLIPIESLTPNNPTGSTLLNGIHSIADTPLDSDAYEAQTTNPLENMESADLGARQHQIAKAEKNEMDSKSQPSAPVVIDASRSTSNIRQGDTYVASPPVRDNSQSAAINRYTNSPGMPGQMIPGW